jgi:hypothetical protein
MGCGVRKAGAAVSTSTKALKSASRSVLSVEDAICRLTGAGDDTLWKQVARRGHHLLWTYTRTVS